MTTTQQTHSSDAIHHHPSDKANQGVDGHVPNPPEKRRSPQAVSRALRYTKDHQTSKPLEAWVCLLPTSVRKPSLGTPALSTASVALCMSRAHRQVVSSCASGAVGIVLCEVSSDPGKGCEIRVRLLCQLSPGRS